MAALRDSRSSCACGLLMRLVLTVCLLMYAASANAQTLEGVLREIQARRAAIGLTLVSWPNGPGGCTVDYPPDGFYDGASNLVQVVNSAITNLDATVHPTVRRFLVIEWVASLNDGSQGVKHEYEYTAAYSTGSGQPMGLSTRVTESLSDAVGSYDTPYRITYYDMHKLGTDQVPYLINKVIAEVGEGREWVWRTEYDSFMPVGGPCLVSFEHIAKNCVSVRNVGESP